MSGFKLFNGTKGMFNAMKYEISKESGVKTDLNHPGAKGENGIDESMINKIIELSEK